MKGDFTRNTFNPDKHFLRVLMQQGRVQLDADWNEQAAILLHYLQTLAADLIGPYAGPAGENLGFAVKPGANGDFTIGKGRYYVNGILCENEQDITYFAQLDYPLSGDGDALPGGNFVVYLDVWERHITFVEDDDIREKALNGPDTASRTKIVWQVKVIPMLPQYAYCRQSTALLTDKVLVLSQICMSARARQDPPSTKPCLTEPEASYRGAENQLYRVEIHDGNFDIDDTGMPKIRDPNKFPTFKFSRENGTVIFPVLAVHDGSSGTVMADLEHLGCDDKRGLAVNDWVEFVDDSIELLNQALPLFQVQSIDPVNRTVTLTGTANVDFDIGKHPFLRRWDQGTANKVNGNGLVYVMANGWLALEDGIEVKFSALQPGALVRRGDYWLIPARTITGDVEWPVVAGGLTPATREGQSPPIPKALPPMGTVHTYAPLAIINVSENNAVRVTSDCRCSFNPLSYTCQYSYFGRLGIGTQLICPQDNEVNQ